MAPGTADAVSWSVPPAHTAPVFPAVGGAGTALTVVFALDELFAAEGSLTADATAAVLVAVPGEAGALIVTAIGGAAPTPRVARVHVTVDVPLQAQPDPDADTRDAPAGSVSETETEVAVEGPAFVTCNV